MDLQRAEQLAIELMEKHGLRPKGLNTGLYGYWSFDWHRKKMSSGTCSYTRNTIFLSKPITELSKEEDVLDTILHEIAHALTPHHGHDAVWKKKAKEIGCKAERCFGEDSKTSQYNAVIKLSKYIGECPGGHTHYRNKMTKGRKSCSLCSPKFDANYIIDWKIQNK